MMSDALLAAVPPLSQIFGRVAFAAALASVAALIALHVVKPELHPSWHMVSEYAVGPHGWLMTICFAGLAIGCAALAVALVPNASSWVVWLGLVLLAVAVVGLSMGAIFPTDPITVAPKDASPTAQLHALAVLIGNPPFVIAALVLSYSALSGAAWDPVRWQLLILAHLMWISLGVMIAIAAVLLPRMGGFGPNVPIGWPNRALMIAYAGWLTVAAWPLAFARTG